MSEETKIEWATHSWNPWEGCTKVSPGCANCYAAVRDERFHGGAHWGKDAPRRRTSAANWRLPLRWDAASRELTGYTKPHPPRVFPSLCDWLDDEVPVEWLADFLKLIHDTPHLEWLLLTKRPENWKLRMQLANGRLALTGNIENPHGDPHLLAAYMLADWLEGKPPANIWLGVSVEDQARADERIPELLRIPARVRFLSVEPLLGPVNLFSVSGLMPRDVGGAQLEDFLHWVIAGGESGPGARPCNVEWIRSIVAQCSAAGVPCFVKQLGSNAISLQDDGTGGQYERRLKFKHPKGGDPSEWPANLRVRQFPNP